MTLASLSAINFSKSASVLSSTEAGPACFFRKLTMPSSHRKKNKVEKDGHEARVINKLTKTAFMISKKQKGKVPADLGPS